MTHTDEPKVASDAKGQEEEIKPQLDKVLSPKVEKAVSKQAIRNAVWNLCPESCKFRIPRFENENEAVNRLKNLSMFQNAKVIATSLDRTLELVRREAIESGKDVVIGTPGLRGSGFLIMKPPVESTMRKIKVAASTFGMKRLSKPLELTTDLQIDLVIFGSVAVDKNGNRIGKGKGFSDLEYALLSNMGRIDRKTLVLTIVDDFQVCDNFHPSLFKPHDVSVDYVITPTQTINIRKPSHPNLMVQLLPKGLKKRPIIKMILKERKKENAAQKQICPCGRQVKKKSGKRKFNSPLHYECTLSPIVEETDV